MIVSGLTETEVKKRQALYGLNVINKKDINLRAIFIRQFIGNPLLIILTTATFLSLLLGQGASSIYIFAMILLSIILGFWNEYSAEKVVDGLLKKIAPMALIIRDGIKKEVEVKYITIGDVVLLAAGSIIPADLKLIETNGMEINESALTGESNEVHKEKDGLCYMGTIVESGQGTAVVTQIGKATQFGKIAITATFIHPTTEFQKGLEKFGSLLVKVIIILTIGIFGINALLGKSILDSLIFALAIAVGLTPELLPVIVTVSLAHGAGKLAKKHVIAKKLLSLENLGNMDVLATDKTGTLTEGKINVVDFVNEKGKTDMEVLKMALFANSALTHHKVIGDPIDVALINYANENKITLDESIKKIDEEPFDYNIKAMYSVIEDGKKITLIAKGNPDKILSLLKNKTLHSKLKKKLDDLASDGYRTIALATKTVSKKDEYNWEDAKNLDFVGYITFLDTPKKGAKEAINKLEKLNVEIKVITGDNEIITKKVCSEVGMTITNIALGSEIDTLTFDELKEKVKTTNIFARMNPDQKLKVIRALQANGHTVGYLGDGINDIPALHNSDVGISVNTGVDVAKDAASIVLLKKSLSVIADGIVEGRRTFNNTIKYILMGTSSNFGNMLSASGASFILPFLPMTPLQILLGNSLYDVSQLSISSDNVDPESLLKPRHWNIDLIKKYMLFFGPISSVYDYITFAVMIFVFHARNGAFQTGWFIESLATQILVVFAIRTSRTPFYKSRPGKYLTITCLSMVAFGIILPFTPLAHSLGFVAPNPFFFVILLVMTITYVGLVEFAKALFFKRYNLW